MWNEKTVSWTLILVYFITGQTKYLRDGYQYILLITKASPTLVFFLHGKEIIIRVPKGLAKKGTTAKKLYETTVWGEIQRQTKSAIFLCQQSFCVNPIQCTEKQGLGDSTFLQYWQYYFLIPCHIPELFSWPTVLRFSIPKQTQALRKDLWPNSTSHKKGNSSEPKMMSTSEVAILVPLGGRKTFLEWFISPQNRFLHLARWNKTVLGWFISI